MIRTVTLPRVAATVAAAVLAACAGGDLPELGRSAGALGTGGGVVLTTPDGSFVPGELMVQLDHALTTDRVVLGGVGFTVIEQMPSGAWRLAIDDLARVRATALARRDLADDDRAAAEASTLDALSAVAAESGVISAYLNILLTLSRVPSDPLYQFQRWNYEAVHLPAAWDSGFGVPEVHLALIDSESSVDQHPDLRTRWGTSVDLTPKDYDGKFHHGAHVAGIAGAATDNPVGGAGVCGGCTLDLYRVTGQDTDLAEVEQALQLAGGSDFLPPPGGAADAINLSMNFQHRPMSNQPQTCSTPETAGFATAVRRAISRKVTIVVSAGNFSGTGPAFPADCPDVISVAATQPGGQLAPYSNRGGTITLAAPGGGGSSPQFGASAEAMPCPPPPPPPPPPADQFQDPYSGTDGVMSAWVHYISYLDPGQITADDYCERYLSGTSMAAPHVTGTVGLMRSQNKDLSPSQVKDILVRTAQTHTPCPTVLCGAGLLDAEQAVRYAPLGGVPVATLADVGLGDVTRNTSATGSASLRNDGSATMTPGTMSILGGGGQIEFAFPSGLCTSGTTCNQPVAPVVVGQSAAIPLRCKPTVLGPISATLSIQGDMLRGPAQATVRCNGVALPDVTVTPPQLSFPATVYGTASAAQPVTVRNDGGGTLGVSASIAGSNFALACTAGCTCAGGSCTASLTAGQSATLAVRFTPTGGPGPATAQLTIATPADPDEPSTAIALTGTALTPLIGIDPPGFPVTVVGESSVATAQVRNAGTALLHVSQLVLDDITGVFTFSGTCDGLRVCAVSIDLAPGASASVGLRFRPVRGGMLLNRLTATASSPDSPQSRVFGATGLAPTFALEGVTAFDFGNVRLTTSATQDFTIRNLTAGTTLTWTASTAPPFSLRCVSGPCSCAAGACSGATGTTPSALRMTFTPTSPGPVTGGLTVQTNDPAAPTRQYQATGTGLLVPIGPPPGPGDPIDPAM